MSALAFVSAGARGRDQACPARAGRKSLGGEPTLDELLAGVWEGLAAHHAVACPVCGDEMTPEYGVHARPIGGRCGSCQTTLIGAP